MPSLNPLASGVAAVASLLVASAVPADAQERSSTQAIMGGPSGGTYLEIAQDISDLAGSCGIDLEVVESEGGFDNFLAVRNRPATQFGLTHSDVLSYMQSRGADDAAVREAASGMQVALPLYDEEVQVLAGRDIESLEDLDGLRVGVGPGGSGTFLTSRFVMDLAGVEPAERVSIPLDEMLPALLAGELDAFFVVAGAPAALLQSPEIDAEAHHLLPITDEALRAAYDPVTIPAGTYDHQEEAVETVAARAVLMTYDFQPGRDAYHTEACDTVSDVSHLIVTRLEELRAEGHPKWSRVDLTDIPPGWEVASCVIRGLEADYTSECAPQADRQPQAEEEDPDAAATGEDDINQTFRRQVCTLVDC